MTKQGFINQCINNRKYLNFSIKDMCNCLDNVSEKDYLDFESGKKSLSEENLKRLIRVLCIDNKEFDIKKYIQTEGMDEDTLSDLEDITRAIVGAEND